MKRRGPRHRGSPQEIGSALSSKHANFDLPEEQLEPESIEGPLNTSTGLQRFGLVAAPSFWSPVLDPAERLLLDHYINRFSRSYPTLSGPDNPFLQILVPLATQSSAVLASLLALSGVQSFGDQNAAFEQTLLKLRHKALRGCRALIGPLSITEQSMGNINIGNAFQDRTELLFVLASCGLLLLYEKLTNEGHENCTPHLQFFSRLLSDQILPAMDHVVDDAAQTSWHSAFKFLRSLFLYNDLVRATSFATPSMVKNHLDTISRGTGLEILDASSSAGRFEFTHIISRLSHGDLSVTDADIELWSGRLDWIPSFALTSERDMAWPSQLSYRLDHIKLLQFRELEHVYKVSTWDDRVIICELYRVAAMIYKRQCFRRSASLSVDMGNLPSWATQLVCALPIESAYANMLLWPIGIVTQELGQTCTWERSAILTKLDVLQCRYNMSHFWRIRIYLTEEWQRQDCGAWAVRRTILFG